MGAVYKARDVRLDRDVALKILPPGLREDGEALERFRREARTLAQLKHPGVASVFDADVEGDFPYLVMEFVEGENLEQLLRRRGTLPTEEVVRIGIEMAEALEHIHCHGIVHRDLKSANTIIGPEGRAVVVDFGVAHVGSLPRISQGTLGTPEYMSPEQAQGQRMDGRSDIYSVGVVLYECLAGELPFPKTGEGLSGLADVLQRVVEEAAAPVRNKRKDVPQWLDDVIQRCLSKRPEDRFTSAADLAVALRKARYDEAQAFEDAHQAVEPSAEAPLPPPPEAPPPIEDIVAPAADVRRNRSQKVMAHQGAQGLVISHLEAVDAIAFNPNGRRLVSTSKDGGIRLWDARSGRLIQLLRGHNALAVSFSKGGSRMATGGVDGAICIWDVAKEQPLHRLEAHKGFVLTVEYSRDGKYLASGGIDGAVRIWRSKTGRLIRTLGWQYGYVLSVSFSPDGRHLASGGADGAVRIWDVGTGDALNKLKGHAGYVSSVSFSKNGQRLASGSADGTIRIWDVSTGNMLRKLEGHSDWVTSVAFNPDGSQLVSGSRDRTVCLWDVEKGQGLRRFRGHKGAVTTVAFSPDGYQLASSSSDHTVRVWSLTDKLPARRIPKRATVAVAVMMGFGALGMWHEQLAQLPLPEVNWQGLWDRIERVFEDATSSIQEQFSDPPALAQDTSPAATAATAAATTARPQHSGTEHPNPNRTPSSPPETPPVRSNASEAPVEREPNEDAAFADSGADSEDIIAPTPSAPSYTSATYGTQRGSGESTDLQAEEGPWIPTNPPSTPARVGDNTSESERSESQFKTETPDSPVQDSPTQRTSDLRPVARSNAELFSADSVAPILDTFTLIVADKPTRQQASTIAASFHEAGYRTGILRIVFNGKLTYRVAIGQFKTYQDATDIRQALAGDALPYDTWIMRIRT